MLKVTLRNLAAHKLRLVLTALSVILGVAFVAGTLIFTDTINKAFDEIFEGDGRQAVVVRGEKPAGDNGEETATSEVTVPQTLLPALRKIPGIAEVHGSVQGHTAVVDKDGDPIGGGGPPQLGLNWTGGEDLTAGRAPAGPGEVVLDQSTAEKAEVGIGDRVKVAVAGGVKDVTVSGLTEGENGGATLVFWETAAAQKLLLKPGEFSTVTLEVAPGGTEKELTERVAATLPGGLEAITGEQLREEERSDIDAMLGFLRNFLLAAALVSIIVGSFNIFNTFSMLVAQRTRELALLRAVGASRRQITRAVLGEAVAVGVVGATFGLALGAGLAALLKAVFEGQGMEMSGSLVFTATPVIASYAVGVLVTCLAAYFPARRAAKIPPVAAMRDDVALPQRSLRIRAVVGTLIALAGAVFTGLGLSGSGSTEETLSLLGVGVLLIWLAAATLAAVIGSPVVKLLASWYPKVFGVAGRMARENPRRNPRRTGVTAVALMIGLSLVTTVNVLTASIKATMDEMVDEQFGVDYAVSSTTFQGMGPDLVKSLREVPGVVDVVETGDGEFQLNGENTWYVSGDFGALLKAANARLLSGDTATGPDRILLGEEEAEKNSLKAGDTVKAVFPDGESETLRVGGVYSDNDMIGSRLLSPEAWKAHTTRALPTLLILETERTDAKLRAAVDAAVDPYPGVVVQDKTDLKEQVQSQLDMIMIFFTLMLALSVIIAVFGVINTIVLSVIERTRELGLLRAVGLSRRQLRRMVRLESVAIALFGGLLGIGLGVGFGAAIQHSASEEISVLAIPTGFLIGCVLFSVLVGILASLWPAWRAGRMDVLKAIATQ
ncbi:ABC transporter permease [Actinocorallia populi]|uniref:ABC transporter permease n=1 Tax=Actinocorallia populi TaxID=2079200 RepID=UPI000D0956E7|nr:ABC transporter permease [Actinocorallia populi]